jgi:hypothetical protein
MPVGKNKKIFWKNARPIEFLIYRDKLLGTVGTSPAFDFHEHRIEVKF